MSIFSQEMQDLFVDSIDDSREGKKALSACMLVSWSFFVRARSRLFSTVDLGPFCDARSLLGLLRYQAIGYPALGPCIKKLKVWWDTDFRVGFATHYAVLLLLSHPTCKVVDVEMNFSTGDFPEIDPLGDAYRAIQAICSASTLRRLRLLYVSDFPEELFDICQLEELHMDTVGFKIASNPNSSSASTVSLLDAHSQPLVSRLRRFAFVCPINIPILWQQPRKSPFCSLQSLLVQLDDNTEGPKHDFNTLLLIAQETLENLSLHLSPGFFQAYPHSLQPLNSLRSLTFVCHGRYSSTPRADEWQTETLLESLASMEDVPASLQQISVHLNIYRMDSAGKKLRDRLRKDLLDTLSGPRFNSVSNIEVVIQLIRIRDVDVDAPFLVDFKSQTTLEYPRIQVKMRRFSDLDHEFEFTKQNA